MSFKGEFTVSDLLEYEKAKNEVMLYLTNMLNIYRSDKNIHWMMSDRIKSLSSINEKISKKKKEKGNDFDINLDLMDIAGLRVIFCDKEDIVPNVEDLDNEIHNWSVDQFECEFTKSTQRANNCRIIGIYEFVEFVAKNNDNVIIMKDYITYPKDSGYQSLHVIIIASNGCPVEIQFRNYTQHLFSEFEHDIRYKDKNSVSNNYENIFDRCAYFLKGISESALERIRDSKKYMFVR